MVKRVIHNNFLFVVAVFFLIVTVGCGSDAEKDSAQQKSTAKPHTEKNMASEKDASSSDEFSTEIPSGFKRIPTRPIHANSGEFHSLWGPLLHQKEVYVPSFDELPDMTPDSARPVKASEITRKALYVQNNMNGQMQSFNVLYTDTRLFTSTQLFSSMSPVSYLKEVLFDTTAAGVAFNPPSRVMKRDLGDVTYLMKTGIAELIGFLETGGIEPDGTPYSQLAVEAFNKNQPYQVLYYWMKSYRTPRLNDDWKQAEASKLKAYWELNFPGSRKRAKGELDWFMNTHGANPELETLSAFWADR